MSEKFVYVAERLYKLLSDLNKTGNPVVKRLLEDSVSLNTDFPVTVDIEKLHYEIDFLDISLDNPEYISYATPERLEKMMKEGRIWDKKLRYHGRPSKSLRKMYGDVFSSDAYAEFSRLFFKQQCPDTNEYQFKLLEGQDVRWGYDQDNYTDHYVSDGLHGSCMADSEKNHYMNLYAFNPKNIKLGVMLKDDLVAARCLVWMNVRMDGKKCKNPCYDRIYSSSDRVEVQLVRKLQEIGAIDIYQTEKKVEVQLDRIEELHNFPYLDTFRYSDGDGLFNNKGGEYTYDDPDGDRRQSVMYKCANCGDAMCEDSILHFADGTMNCDDCAVWSSVAGQYYLKANVVKDGNDDWIPKEQAIKDVMGEWWMQKLCSHDRDGGWVRRVDSIVTAEGYRFHEEMEGKHFVNVKTCDEEGNFRHLDYFLIDAAGIVQVKSGEYIAKDEAIEIDGNYYHSRQTVLTLEGDFFPIERTDYYQIIENAVHTIQKEGVQETSSALSQSEELPF